MNTLNKTFLPVTLDECHARGWDAPDFVYVCGDAYVDHPSFGLAIISRILEKAGYRVAMLCLPPWQDASAFKQFGKPRLGFLVSAGVIDSMVNHYTVAKKRRHDDAYAPGGKGFMRPDRATIVYCNRIRQAYRDVFIAVMGDNAKAAGLKLMHELRQEGVCVQMDIMGRKIKNQFKYADRIHAEKTIVIGDDELANNSVQLKDMTTSEQTMVPLDRIVEILTEEEK